STSFVFTVKGGILIFYTSLHSAAAFVLWSYLLKYNRAGEIGFYLFAIPLLGTLLSVIFLSEPFTINLIFSLLLVCGGIVLVNLNSSSKKPKIKG
ncbi:MAG: EamA family transporter, partial [Spirochaetales bacterium]|nr:EamA family transporter [Spirochaetales bacterium]